MGFDQPTKLHFTQIGVRTTFLCSSSVGSWCQKTMVHELVLSTMVSKTMLYLHHGILNHSTMTPRYVKSWYYYTRISIPWYQHHGTMAPCYLTPRYHDTTVSTTWNHDTMVSDTKIPWHHVMNTMVLWHHGI